MISIDEQLLAESLQEDNDDNNGQQKFNDRLYLNQSMPIRDETGLGQVNQSQSYNQANFKSRQLPPELTLKNIVKRNPNIRERIRLSSLAEVAERHLLQKNLDKLLGGKNVLSGLNQLQFQQLLYLAPQIQNLDGSLNKSQKGRNSTIQSTGQQSNQFAYFSAPPLERADARFKKIVSMSNKVKQDNLQNAPRAIDSTSNFQQPPMCFAVNQIPGLTQQKKQLRKNKPGSSPMRLRNMIKQTSSNGQISGLLTFKRKLNSPTKNSPKKQLRKNIHENRSNSKSFGMSGRISSRDKQDDSHLESNNTNNNGGGQSIYKVQIEKDEIAEAIEQLMDRGDQPKMDIEKSRKGNKKDKSVVSPQDEAFAGLTGEDKQKQQFDEDLARLLNQYRPKVTLWKSTLGDKLFLLDNVDKVKGHSFEELQKQLKQITKAHH